MDGRTGSSSSSNNKNMSLAAHLRLRLRALRSLLLDNHQDKPAPSSAAASAASASSSSSRRHRRGPTGGVKVMACWALLALAGLILLFNVFESQGVLFGSLRRGGGGGGAGLRAAGGTRGAVLLPRRAVKQVLYDCGAAPSDSGGGCAASGLLILQSSDGRGGYARMLDATQGVQLAYAQQWGFAYLRWDGLAKGRQAWHATYNRIYLLSELHRLRHQHRHRWVLFMDPDAIFVDPKLSVEDLLDERYAVIGCRGGEDPDMPWDINIGVAFFNLHHPEFARLISQWLWQIRWVPEAKMDKGSTETYVAMGEAPPVRDDQQMLHMIMQRHPMVREVVKRYMDENSELFNYGGGKYVAHLIRADNKDQEARLVELLKRKSDFFRRLAELEAERAGAAGRALEESRRRQREEGPKQAEKEGGGA